MMQPTAEPMPRDRLRFRLILRLRDGVDVCCANR